MIVLMLMLSSAFFWSWLSSAGHLNVFSDELVNPQMEMLHYPSANISIGLAIIMIIVTSCLLSSRRVDSKTIAKKVAASFFSGVFIALGFCICGQSARSKVILGLTPGTNWDPLIIVFLAIAAVLSSILNKLVNRYF